MSYRKLVKDLIYVSLLHRCRISKAAQKAGLYYGQPVILEYIKDHNLCTQNELAKALHISPASAATSLKRIEKAGLIARLADEADTRKNRLALTEEGQRALKRFRKICDETDSEMFKDFTAEECETLRKLLERLYKNLDTGEFSRDELHAISKGKTLSKEDTK